MKIYEHQANSFQLEMCVECSPSGPTAFWSLRDHVSNENALVVAQHADVSLRNELGMTLLHATVAKRRLEGKHDVIATLLSRGVDVSARDFEGSTARDYVIIHDVGNGFGFKFVCTVGAHMYM